MWLRDFLHKDLPSCRVMTYGCNLKLASNMLHTFQDLCAEFLEAMKVARASEEVSYQPVHPDLLVSLSILQAKYRPLVLIGHSYGSRIITKVITSPFLYACKLRV